MNIENKVVVVTGAASELEELLLRLLKTLERIKFIADLNEED